MTMKSEQRMKVADIIRSLGLVFVAHLLFLSHLYKIIVIHRMFHLSTNKFNRRMPHTKAIMLAHFNENGSIESPMSIEPETIF